MTEPTSAVWTVRIQGPPAAQVVVEVREPESTAERDQLLTRGVVDAMTSLVQAYRSERPVVVDLRVADTSGDVDPGTEAFVEAVRGLVQSFVLEIAVPVRPINIVISAAGRDVERARTVEYLASADGSFACGATYDLREERP